jgi:ParB family chromosome partitioning protein
LLGLKDQTQSEAARRVVSQGLSVRETEKLVRRLQGEEPAATKGKETTKVDPNIRSLENGLTEKLGAMVKIQSAASGKGRMVISYNSLDELEGILEHIH